MSVIDTLITDRTQADCDRAAALAAKGLAGMTAAECAEYLAGMKGAYNAADMNRVTEAMEYIAERFREKGYSVALSHTRTWSMSAIPTPEQTAGYLADLAALRNMLAVPSSVPTVPPDMDGMTVQEANDIERILAELDRLLTLAAESWLRCGNVNTYCNQRGLPTETASAIQI